MTSVFLRRIVRTALAALLVLGCIAAALAVDAGDNSHSNVKSNVNSNAQDGSDVKALIKAKVDKLTGGSKLGPIRPAVIHGLYTVQVIGGPTMLVTADAKHVIMGDLYNLTATGLTPVQDPYMVKQRKAFIASLGPKDTIDFAPKGKTKAVVYVFNDVDCGYCRRLHSQITTYKVNGVSKPGYNDLGIEIRYLAYPRAGINSSSAAKLESAWCAKDPKATLHKLMSLESVPPATCKDNPVAEQFTKGGELGVTGTPSIMLADGRMVVGYRSPQQLLQTIQQAH